MSRYKDADALRRKVKTECNPYGKPSIDFESGKRVLDMIDKQPTADVVPVKHGYWKGKPLAGYSTVRCSVCGHAFMENSGKWKYCPDCGAQMDESTMGQAKGVTE